MELSRGCFSGGELQPGVSVQVSKKLRNALRKIKKWKGKGGQKRGGATEIGHLLRLCCGSCSVLRFSSSPDGGQRVYV